MRFCVDRHYYSDEYSIHVVGRFDRSGLIRAEFGFGLPRNYKIRKGYAGKKDVEHIIVKGHVFEADR